MKPALLEVFNTPPWQSSPKRKVYFIHLSDSGMWMFQVCEYRSAQVCASIYESLGSESPVPQKLELNRLKLNGFGSLPNPFSLSQLSALLCKSSQSSSKTTLALSLGQSAQQDVTGTNILQDRQVHSLTAPSSRCLDNRAIGFSTATLPTHSSARELRLLVYTSNSMSWIRHTDTTS